jgi:hypothetical protein
MQYALKILISALILVAVSEISKRFALIGAITASLPLTSILAILWLYHDTKDVQKIIDLSHGIFWAVLPSLLFFIVLPVLLKMGFGFNRALLTAGVVMVVGYTVYVLILEKFGIKI